MALQNLSNLVDKKVITKDGANWMRTALDPFHDYAQEFEGFPDQVSTRSRITMSSSTYTISAPGIVAFNARVWVNPITVVTATAGHKVLSNDAASVDVDMATTSGDNGIIMIEAYDDGVNPNAVLPGATLARDAIGHPSNASDQRVVAVGFEVVNTTAPIYQSGSVVCVRYPGGATDANVYIEDTTAVTAGATRYCNLIELPPGTTNTAMNMPGTTQWHSKDGCYMVGRLSNSSLPVHGANEAKPALYGASAKATEATWIAHLGLDATSGHLFSGNQYEHGFDMPVAYFSGLSPETTLQVTSRVYYEQFPRGDDSLVPMCSPSPKYDMAALQLYGEVAQTLPNSVPVNMNPGGEYFRMVMRAIATVLKSSTPALSAIHPAFGPAAQLGGMLLQHAAGQEQAKKKKAAPPKQRRRVGWGSVGGVPSSARRR